MVKGLTEKEIEYFNRRSFENLILFYRENLNGFRECGKTNGFFSVVELKKLRATGILKPSPQTRHSL